MISIFDHRKYSVMPERYYEPICDVTNTGLRCLKGYGVARFPSRTTVFLDETRGEPAWLFLPSHQSSARQPWKRLPKRARNVPRSKTDSSTAAQPWPRSSKRARPTTSSERCKF